LDGGVFTFGKDAGSVKKDSNRSRDVRTRRHFLQAAGIGSAACVTGIVGSVPSCAEQAAGPKVLDGAVKGRAFELAVASYTFRKFDLAKTLDMTRRLGLKFIALKDYHLPLNSTPETIAEVVTEVKKSGLELYGGGVIYMNSEAEVNQAFDYAKAAGMKVIIGVPKPELLPLVNEKVRQYDIKVAVHNHGPGKLYPTPDSAYEKIKDLDRRLGLCNDIGHTMRAGIDPSVSVERLADRLLDVHIKDVSAAEEKGKTVEIGRGVINIPRFLRALVMIGYAGKVAFEYEKDADDPLPGLAESVGYVRGMLAAI
jgi:sugar phosphate isomerase/epimerase